ncbi:MAG: hypothetical protein GX820_11550, partial [Bacteroidales bacterium]|nr:hypothetical protein [Bacteroidales bacterium]
MSLKKKRYLPIIIFAIAFLLYGNTIYNDYSLDDIYVTQNNPKVMKGLAGIPEIVTGRYVNEEGNIFGYRPVATITFAIENKLWGQNPHLGHLINVLLYALSIVLLFNLLKKIFREQHILFLLTVVLLFIAHPIHTEVVASLKNRETLLSFLFSLISLHLFLKWTDNRKVWQVIAGILAFIIAFLSKQDAVTFAAIIPLALFYYTPYQFNYPSLKEIYKHLFGNPNRYITLAGLSFIFFYITTRGLGAILSALSYFSTITFLILYNSHLRKKAPGTKQNKFSWIFIASGVIFFLLMIYTLNTKFALLSLLLFALFFARISDNKKIKKILTSSGWLPFLIPAILLSLAAVIFHKMPNLYLPPEDKMLYHFENPQFVNSDGYSTWPVAFYSLFFYLKKLIWPHPLGFYYGYKMIPEVGWTSPEVLISAVFHIAILAYAVWKLPKKHILSFSILYYFTAISIFTNIVIQIPGIVGERM